MTVRYVLDENLRGILWRTLQRDAGPAVPWPIDVTCVGERPDLPLGTIDPDLLEWAYRNDRVLVTRDQRSMPVHFADRLAMGKHSAGVFVIRKKAGLVEVMDFLMAAAHASEAEEWRDRIVDIPQ